MKTPYRPFATALFAAGLIAAASLPASAGNMAFRYQMEIVPAGLGQIGNNWVSLPYFNPYGTAAGLCTLTGLTSTGLARATIGMVDPATGAFSSATCGTVAAGVLRLIPGRCVRIRQPAQTGAPASILLVGSHDPALAVTIPDAGAGNIGNLWYAIPWHTTAQNVNELCTQQGLSSAGLARAACLQVNPATGASTIVTCATAAGAATMPAIGRCCRFREPNGPITWVPQTY
jgi:hypothetical protein